MVSVDFLFSTLEALHSVLSIPSPHKKAMKTLESVKEETIIYNFSHLLSWVFPPDLSLP